VLARHGLAPSRERGQNFLRSPELARRLVATVGLTPEDAAVEVGPGLGQLTRAIAEVARRTVALELDRGLVKLLREQLDDPAVEVRQGDALRTDLGGIVRDLGPPVVLLGNLPYRIAGRLLAALLAPRNPCRRMGLMVQAEMAERVLARPGESSYGPLSVWASLWTVAAEGLELGPEAFEPRPRVRSTFLVLEPVRGPQVEDVPLLRRLVRSAFQQRRKMLRTALRREFPRIAEVAAEAGIDPRRRPQTLTPEEFVRLANLLAERVAS
jgi:16S rRNA (adenine1518-N6/adenine1519-N6)-dimethyltransferase